MNLSFLLPLTCTVFYVFITLLLGLILLKLIFQKKWKSFSALVILATSFMIGQGLLAAIWLILALIGQFKSAIILTILISISIISIMVWKDLFRLFKKISEITRSAFASLSFFWKLLLVMLALLALFFATGAIILPPSGDAEAFYMVLPKIVAGTGILQLQPNYYDFSKLGFLGEAHYAALMSLANFHAAKFFVWFTMLAAAGFIVSIGTLLNVKARGQIIALAILLTSTTFTNYITDGKVDIFSAAFGLAAFYWVLETKRKEIMPLVLTGLFLGFAVVTKLSNFIAVFPGVILIIIWNCYLEARLEKKLWQIFLLKTIKFLAILFLFFGFAITPHLIKNKTLFNNPFALSNKYQRLQWVNPVWSSSSAVETSFTAQLPHSALDEQAPEPSRLKQLFSPLSRILTYPLAFIFGDRGGQGGNLSVLILILLPFLFFSRLTLAQKQVLVIFAFSLTFWIAVRAAAITPRYILPTLLIFIPLIAAKAESIFELKKFMIVRTLIVTSLIITLSVMLLGSLYFTQRFSWVVFKGVSPTFLYGSHYPALQFINNRASGEDRVFLVGYYGFFLRPDLLNRLDNEEEKMAIVFYRHPSPWEYIYEHGFKYVIVQKAPHLPVMGDLDSQRPKQLNIQKIYSDPLNDVYLLEKK